MKQYRAFRIEIILPALLSVCLTTLGCRKQEPAAPKETVDYVKELPKDKAARMAWWKEARFGMFIHWGLYAIPAGVYNGRQVPSLGEWIMNNAEIPVAEYEKLAPKFNPLKFDADKWVDIAEQAGMKYIVITSKHHDGFALWDSKVSNWDVMERTPFKRDILRELEGACKRAKMPLGFYYSIMDWHHPKAQASFFPKYNDLERSSPKFDEYAETYMKPQIDELLHGYDIDILWFDGQWIADWNILKGRDLYNHVRRIKPEILVNNRVGQERQKPYTCQQPMLVGDFMTPEQQVPEDGLPGIDWESCITMNKTWGYKTFDYEWKSATLLIRLLVDIVSKGGNLLLNVGPTAEGLIPEASVERLTAMGNWLKVNGESIYGTKSSPFGEASWGRYTIKGSKLFAHVMVWPKNGKLSIRKPKERVNAVYLLSDAAKTPLKYSDSGRNLIVEVPPDSPDPAAAVVVIESEAPEEKKQPST